MIQLEIGFNVLYLLSIYLIVGLMYHRYRSIYYANQPGSVPFLWAFLLLALGDTGHVGFRLLAFARGGLEKNEVLGAGFEPAQALSYRILSPARLTKLRHPSSLFRLAVSRIRMES